MQQLTIFDALPIEKEFGINDVLEVVTAADVTEIETYYYLQDFAGLKGRVIKAVNVPDLQYEIQYEKK